MASPLKHKPACISNTKNYFINSKKGYEIAKKNQIKTKRYSRNLYDKKSLNNEFTGVDEVLLKNAILIPKFMSN